MATTACGTAATLSLRIRRRTRDPRRDTRIMMRAAVLRSCVYLALLLACSARAAVLVSAAESPTVITMTPENEAVVREAVHWYSEARQAAGAGRREDAIRLYEQTIDTYALLAGAYNNLAMLVAEVTGDRARALDVLERGEAAATATNDTGAFAAIRNNMGVLVREQDRRGVAASLTALAHFDAALAVAPEFVDALYNKASALHGLRQSREAEALLRRVLQLDAHHEGAHIDLGAILFARGEIDAAVEHGDAVIGNPTTSTKVRLGTMHNNGQYLKDEGRLLDALDVHERAVAIAPTDAISLSDLVTSRRTLCRWHEREPLQDRMLAAVHDELRNGSSSVALLPYDATLIALSDEARKPLAVAHSSVYEQSSTLALLPLRSIDVDATAQRRPLRVGYLSFDFREHPMGQLTLGLLDAHDSSRVERFCYSYGEDDQSEWRRRAEQRCDVFHDVRVLSDLSAAQRIALDEVDIVVDLMAHTKGARLGITALRPSRIVVNYLGFPGTMGSRFTDTALVDRLVVPPEFAAARMTENVVYLPHVYQVNEYEPHVPSCGADPRVCSHTTRAEHGLPGDPDTVVFCNFNTIDKMEPTSFTVWMHVLRRLPASVLWLLQPSKRHSEQIEATLKDEAAARGVDPARLIFARRVPKREHLARLSLADLFLDSFVYTAHSTAADALWANVPIVSLWGNEFPSRVAAALMQHAVHLPDLTPHSSKEYEDLAVELAQNTLLVRRVRHKLAQDSLIAPLFDTKRTTSNIEAAYEALHDVRNFFHNAKQTSSRPRFQLIVHPRASVEFAPVENSDALIAAAVAHAMAKQHSREFQDAKHVYERVLLTRPDEVDSIHLLGVAMYQLGYLELALQQLDRAVSSYGSIAIFRLNRAVVLGELNRTGEAAADLLDVLRRDQEHTSAFFKLTELLFRESRFAEVVQVFELYGNAYLETSPGIDDEDRERAYLKYSFVLAHTSQEREAIAMLEGAMSRHPFFFRLGYNAAALYNGLGELSVGDELQTRTAVEEARHLYNIKGCGFNKTPRPVDRKVVAIYCHEYGQSWWGAWGPSSLQRGLGGSEEAVVFMSRELNKLGYWVEVYANPPAEDLTSRDANQDADAVQWYPNYAFDPDDPNVDVFIAWRYHVSLAIGAHSKLKYFWVHDMPSADAKNSRLLTELVDGIFCVSAFQATSFPTAVQTKIVITSNALEPAHIIQESTLRDADRNRRFVYGSAPNRGLETLLRAWPRIRASVQNATLRVFYGFTPQFLEWGQRNIHDFNVWKAEMEELLAQAGVEYVGLVDHHNLAREYASAGFYLYPTTFSETSCVSLMKAMANGAIPITSRFPISALSETCDNYDLGPRAIRAMSPDQDKEWIELWIASIADGVANEVATRDLRQRMTQYARSKFRWSRVATQWDLQFKADS